jgi:Transposase DDE domain
VKQKKRPTIEGVAEMAMKLGGKYLADYGHAKSRHDFTQRQLMTLLVLRAYLKATYREVIEILSGHERLRERLGLLKKLPHWTTLHKFSEKKKVMGIALKMSEELGLEAAKTQTSSKAAVDATGMETSTASAHFKACSGKERKKWVKISAAVGCFTILPMALTLGWGPSNDKTQVPELIQKIESAKSPPSKIYFDAGYDAEWIHQHLREKDITTIIKPRKEPAEKPRSGEYRAQMTENYLEKHHYGLRWHVESFWSALKRTMGADLRAKKSQSLLTETAFRLLAYSLRR